jgi:hypothetical protein
LSKRTVFKVLKNFIQNCTEDSLSSGSLESTVNASHILNQQILVEVKNLSKSLEALHHPSITQPVFSEDLYVSVTGDETVYHLSTFKGYKPNVVNDEWVACVLSLLSALSYTMDMAQWQTCGSQVANGKYLMTDSTMANLWFTGCG